MKKLLILAALATASLPAWSQKVPSAVKESFNAAYPEAEKVKWEVANDAYSAQFKDGGLMNAVVINAQGRILTREMEIDKEALPDEVRTYLKSNYAGKPLDGASLQTDSQGNVTYMAVVDGKSLVFDQRGAFVSMRQGAIASKK